MAEAVSRTRGRTCVRFFKCLLVFLLLFIFMLLCLVYIASVTKDKLFQEILRAIKESESQTAEDKYRNATITKLFDLSGSLTNKEKLKIFQETLQAAVEEEERLKAEQHRMVTGLNEFEEKLRQLIPKMEQAKILSANSPQLHQIFDIGTHLLKTARDYLNKKLALLQD